MKNDFISRTALINTFLNRERSEHEAKHHTIPGEDVLEMIQNAPAVDLDDFYGKAFRNGEENAQKIRGITGRPHGDWIVCQDFDGWIECPFCHVGRTVFEKMPKFCENCGADMRQEGEK